MSPIKRTLALADDDFQIPPKRLRGGGVGGIEPLEDFYPDDDFLDEIQPPEEELVDPVNSLAVISDIPEPTRQRWLRPVNQVRDNSEDLNLQWLDMDMTAGAPLEKNPNENQKQIVGSRTGQVPIIRVYGVTEAGNSAAVFIHGFTPYGFFALPPGSTFHNTEQNLKLIRESINNRLDGASRAQRMEEYVRAVSYVTSHKSIMGYDTPHTHFFKIHVAMPTLIPPLKRIMEDGMELAGVLTSNGDYTYEAFECNVPFVLRYMIDRDISGAGWLTMPKKTYQIRPESEKQTHCQVRHCIYV